MKDLKKKAIILSTVLVLTLIAGGAYIFLSNGYNSNNVIDSDDEQASWGHVPALQEVDYDKSPLLYDFLNSSLGYKWDHKVGDEFGDSFYLLGMNKNYPDELYGSWYTVAEKLTFPIIGTYPVCINLNDNEIKSVNDTLKKVDDNRKFDEGDWKFFIITDDSTNKNDPNYYNTEHIWAGVKLNKLIIQETPLMRKTIDGGLGWPTKWLRKDPYIDTMKNAGYNMNDEFWDKYNIGQKLTYVSKDNPDQSVVISIEGLDYYKIDKDLHGNELILNTKKDLDIYLQVNNLELKE